jgi:hypothetical protein
MQRRTPSTRRTPGFPAQQLKGFIAKFEPRHQRLIRAVRRALRRRMPTANELVYDNYNFFVIGYSPTDRPSDSILSIAAGAQGVGLCCIRGAALPDPQRVLQGSGNQTRFIRLASADVLARPEVKALVEAAIRQSPSPAACDRPAKAHHPFGLGPAATAPPVVAST